MGSLWGLNDTRHGKGLAWYLTHSWGSGRGAPYPLSRTEGVILTCSHITVATGPCMSPAPTSTQGPEEAGILLRTVH